VTADGFSDNSTSPRISMNQHLGAVALVVRDYDEVTPLASK